MYSAADMDINAADEFGLISNDKRPCVDRAGHLQYGLQTGSNLSWPGISNGKSEYE